MNKCSLPVLRFVSPLSPAENSGKAKVDRVTDRMTADQKRESSLRRSALESPHRNPFRLQHMTSPVASAGPVSFGSILEKASIMLMTCSSCS